MNVTKQEPETYENRQDSKRPSEDISQRQISQKMACFFATVRISAIIALVFLILSELFKLDVSKVIAGIFVFLLVLSAVLGRSIKFYCKYTSRLGFVTEVAFILGVVFSIISMISGYSYLIAGLPIFSFMIAPGLGIVNRAIKLKRGETENVYYTIIEMFILGMPVVFAIWILLKMK
jgi:hypothetical protein